MALQEERRIDVHTHFIPKHFPEMAKKYSGEGWPVLFHRGLCQADLYHAGKHYWQIDARSWDPERRLKDMDTEGIAVQVLSPIPVTFAYRFSAQTEGTVLEVFVSVKHSNHLVDHLGQGRR